MLNGPQPNATNGGILPPTNYSVQNCSSVDAYCPVEFTIYGYYPSLGANAFFCALFAICCIANFILGLRFKTWTYMIALTVGSLAEVVGYIGRIMMHNNPWSSTGFETQICCLIIAPAFMAAGVYLTLKHVVIELGPEHSALKPMMYTWIFIIADIFSLILQGAGGGIAATSNDNQNLQKVGNDLMITGIVWQVVTLLVFGGLVAKYGFTVFKHRQSLSISANRLTSQQRFKLFTAAITVAYLAIFTRCVYRIAEMANGWKSPIMEDQTDFIVLDGVMVSIATVMLTIFHPGFAFPEMQQHTKAALGEKTVSDVESGTETSPPAPAKKSGWFGSKH